MRAVLFLLVMLALTPSTASAVSVQEIVGLSRSGVSDEVILTLIERDNTIFTIDPDQLVALKKQGVSQAVVLAMLRSGRQPAPAPPAQTADAAVASTGAFPPAPDTVVVGHGPDRPNTYHQGDYPFDSLMAAATVPYLFYDPTPSFCLSAPSRVNSPTVRPGRFMNDPTQRFVNDGTQRFINSGFITEPEIANVSGFTNCALAPTVPARRGHSSGRR